MNVLKIIKPDTTTLIVSFEDLKCFPDDVQLPDVHLFDARFHGQGLTFSTLLKHWGLYDFHGVVKLTASQDQYAIELKLELIRETGILIYMADKQTLSREQGGPFRFMVPGTRVCKSNDVINNCANVKYVDGMEFKSL